MAPRSVFAFSLRALPDPPPGLDNPVLVRRWLVEVWLVRARWWAALLQLLVTPLLPAELRPLSLGLGLGLGAANGRLAWRLLEPGADGARLRAGRAQATALEWAALLAALGLYAGAPRSTAPALLAVPLLLAAGRYGVPGLAAGSAAAAVALAGLLAA